MNHHSIRPAFAWSFDHSIAQSFLTKVKAVSLMVLFATASLSAVTPCCYPTTGCPRVEIELCPLSFCIKDEIVRAAAGLGSGYIITQCDIPLVINCSGKYSLAQDIAFSLGTAITINASQVTLELNDRTINGGGHDGFIGIQVNPNMQNVTIQNGSVIGTFSTAILVSPNCSNITLDHLTANSNGFVGTEIQQNSQDISVKNSQFNYNGGIGLLIREGALHVLIDSIDGSFNGPFGATLNHNGPAIQTAGLALDGISNDLIVKNSNFHDNFSTFSTQFVNGVNLDNQVYGAVFNKTLHTLVENCTFYNLSNVGLCSGLSFFGEGNPTHLTYATIRDCESYSITSTNEFAYGFHLSSNPSQITIDNCIAAAITGFKQAIGLTSSFAQSLAISNCVFQNMTTDFMGVSGGSGTICGGINLFASANVAVRNCVVQNLTSTYTASLTTSLNVVEGIAVTGGSTAVNTISVEDCVVQNIFGSTNLVNGYNFNEASAASVKNCVALNIANTSNALTTTIIAAGFAADIDTGLQTRNFPNQVVFENCISGSVFCPLQSHAYGFLVNWAVESSVLDCVSYGNGIGVALSTITTTTTLQSGNAIVRGNTAYDNTVAGFYDGSNSVNTLGNVFLNNIAYNNGRLNYTKNLVTWGLSADTPIRTWSHSTGFPPEVTNNLGQTPDTFDNLSVV